MKEIRFNLKSCLYISTVCLLLFASCDKETITPGSTSQGSPAMEIPMLKGGDSNLFISHSTSYNGNKTTTYSLEYDCSKKHARWVAFKFYDKTAERNVSRTDAWADDPDIPSQYRSTREDFSGYDRGHICASADRLYSLEANQQTFYYSNMSPQIGNFNQGIWVELEGQVQGWGRNNSFRDTLYVVKGGTIDSENLILTYTNRGPNQLPVPKYYYMALLCKKATGYKTIAFLLEHKNYAKPYNLSRYAVTIDKLEEFTGIDFFPNLPDKAEEIVESQIEISAWPGI